MKFIFPLSRKYFYTSAAEVLSTGGGAGGAGSGGAATGSATGAAGGASPSGAAANAGGGGNAGASGSASSGDWVSGLDEDSRGYVGNKGFKSPKDVLDSYRGLEKLMGAPKDRLLALPERMYDEKGALTAEARAIRERFGAPKEAKGYELASPKEGADPKLTEHFKNVFHELGIPKTDGEKIASKWNEYFEGRSTEMKEVMAQRLKDETTALSKEWGAALEQNTTLAKEAVRVMGFDEQKVAALAQVLGHAETMKLFHKLGTQVKEAPYIGGSRPDRVLEPESARQQIKELRGDRNFGKLLETGDRDARAKWDRLHQMAYPGEVRSG